jgi:hypothetical protein
MGMNLTNVQSLSLEDARFKLQSFGQVVSHGLKGVANDCIVGHPTLCKRKRIKPFKPTKEHYMKVNLGCFMSLNIVKRM